MDLDPGTPPQTVDELVARLEELDYIIDKASATPIFLGLALSKPLLIEGPPGCGKTEVAKVVAKMMGLELIRLQCYEGLDYSHALYEWDYPRQLLEIKMSQERLPEESVRRRIYSENFLLERPLLRSIRAPTRCVLLIDEVDRSDPEFEGFLLEFLSEFQVTIPELGTVKAKSLPFVFITSNNSRDLSDALRRRCLYLNLGYPSVEKETEILIRKAGTSRDLAFEASRLAETIRHDPKILRKPGTAETIDFVSSVRALGEPVLTREVVARSIGALLKEGEDLEHFLADYPRS